MNAGRKIMPRSQRKGLCSCSVNREEEEMVPGSPLVRCIDTSLLFVELLAQGMHVVRFLDVI